MTLIKRHLRLRCAVKLYNGLEIKFENLTTIIMIAIKNKSLCKCSLVDKKHSFVFELKQSQYNLIAAVSKRRIFLQHIGTFCQQACQIMLYSIVISTGDANHLIKPCMIFQQVLLWLWQGVSL